MTGAPRKAVLVVLDSLNRHLLGAYGSTEFDTPNLDRFAKRSVVFDNHYTGSLPCIPARHDLLVGALDFLWRPWGSVEIWEEPLARPLARAGIPTMLVTDHPHLFETGGENYHTDFLAWEYLRGHEGDAWQTREDPSWVGAPILRRLGKEMAAAAKPSFGHPYNRSRPRFLTEADFPGPKTMAATAAWLDDSYAAHDRFLLVVDEFDPHEPFDTPEPYASMYDDTWEGPHLMWPPYTRDAIADGVVTPRQARQIRACYGAKLTMIDAWFGRVLDALDRQDAWDETAVIVTTDHGHYLGERDMFGKPAAPVFQPLAHIPLMVAWPGVSADRSDALTTSVDVYATLADVFGVTPRHATHGTSFRPVLEAAASSAREWLLCGMWGHEVHLITREEKYAAAPPAGNAPLSLWSNRWSTMPIANNPDLRLPPPDDRAWLDRMPGSAVPVIRQPYALGDRMPYWAGGRFDGNYLYALADDPEESRNLAGTPREKRARDDLHDVLHSVGAPSDQYERLGLG